MNRIRQTRTALAAFAAVLACSVNGCANAQGKSNSEIAERLPKARRRPHRFSAIF